VTDVLFFSDHESLRKSEARNAAISQGRSAPRSAAEINGKDSAEEAAAPIRLNAVGKDLTRGLVDGQRVTVSN